MSQQSMDKPFGPLQRLRIFVASPGDVAKERDHVSALAEEMNRGVAAQAGLVLEVVRWETHVRPDMGRPQEIIFNQIGSIDIFIGIMWRRFGTPTGVAGSGTEEEFQRALTQWRQTGRPRILCYFSQAPIEPPPNTEAAEQLLKMAQFRAQVQAAGLSGTYISDTDFKEKLREHLQQILMKEFADRTPPFDRNVLALFEIEKARCRERNIPFLTPNFLFVLLAAPTGLVRRIFDQACPDKAAALVEQLRAYDPPSADQKFFSEFDWYSRADVQAARQCAIVEGNQTIDARHLFLGFLETEGQTRKELQRAVGKKAFDHLCKLAKTAGRAPDTTPPMRGFFNV